MFILGIAGFSGSGKTTLIERLIPELNRRGLRVSVLKHAHHKFDLDQPGKDSYRMREAGAAEVLVASGQRWALMQEVRDGPELPLSAFISKLAPCDLVLVEGYKREAIPRVEVHRRSAGLPLLFPDDPAVVAVVTDELLDTDLPQIDIQNTSEVADFIEKMIKSRKSELKLKVAG